MKIILLNWVFVEQMRKMKLRSQVAFCVQYLASEGWQDWVRDR